MSRPILKAVSLGEPPPRSPERVELASAIEHHAAALDAVRRVSHAREQADEVVYRAADALEAAETALKEAQAGEGARLAAAALGEADGIPSAADAEADVTRAANDLNIARRTRDALDERAQREAAEVERAQTALGKCIGAVVRSEVDTTRLLAEARSLQDALISKRVQLRYLFNEQLVDDQDTPPLRTFLLFENTLPTGRSQLEHGNYNAHPAADSYKRACEALRTDADAPLPS